MPTITISSGTTIVSTPIPNTTAYMVEGTGTLDVDNGGTVSGLITVSSGGHLAVSSGGKALDVLVSSGGDVTVASGGSVTSAGNAITGSGGPGVVINSGTISGMGTDGVGVYLHAGGFITNAADGSITGADIGIIVLGNAGTVVNSGTISASRFQLLAGGVEMAAGGTVTNAASASIIGGPIGVDIAGGPATVDNAGTILALSSGIGVGLDAFGHVDNYASASIVGSMGINLVSGGSVFNGGTITGSGGTAIYFGGSSNLLAAYPGAVFNGVVIGSTSGTNALELKSGGSTGTLAGLGTSFTNFGTVTVDRSAAWKLTGTNTIAPGESLTDDGDLDNTGALSGGVTLGSGGILTNAGGGTITTAGYAVYGTSSGNAVLNSGIITGTGGKSDGIFLEAFATVTNTVPGSITGSNVGVRILLSGGVVNSGSIAGTGASGIGVDLDVGGWVTNAASASITGGKDGILIGGVPETVVNSGTIAGTGSPGIGVALLSGGSITNAAPALIKGVGDGILIDNAAGTVVNSGTVSATGTAGIGIALSSGGSVTNAASASIAGRIGVYLRSGGTVTNAGTITGSGGTAVEFAGTASDRLVIDPGAAFGGTVAGNPSPGNVLELASGGTTGTITGLGTSFTDFAGVTVDSGASWQLSGSNTITPGGFLFNEGTLINVGTLTLSGATLSGGNVVNDGGIVLDPSTLSVGDMTGSGSVTVSSGSVFDVLSGSSGDVIVSSGGTLELEGGAVANGVTYAPGSLEEAGAGETFSNYVVSSGLTLDVASGGTVSGATVSSGGTLDVFEGGTLAGNIVNNGTVEFKTESGSFSGTLSGNGTLVVPDGGDLDVLSAYSGAAQIDDASTLEFAGTYVGAATFSGSPTGSGGTLKLDAPSTGPINVVNSNDTVIAQPGGNDWINATVSYTLPANVDALFLYAGAQGTGNSDASGDALYALDASHAQTLTGNSANDTFVVSNPSDVVVPKAGSHDVVYAAASYTLPTGVDTLILEGTATQGVGNSDAAGDGLYAANPGQVATLTGNSANDAFVVYNSADVVVPKAGSHDVVYAAVSYTLPTGVDVLILEAGNQAVGNSDAAGDALYAANAGIVQTLTGNSTNDTFVVYNSADVVVPKAGSVDIVYSAVNYTLPTGVDSLILEIGTQAVGNSDAAGDTLYAANAGSAQTLTGHSLNDTFVVYNAGDTVTGQAGSADTVFAAVNFTLPTNVDTLFLEGPSATHGTGNGDANNTLYGNAGVASTLVAGSGADILYVTGTAGTIITGGTGADTFAFPNAMGHDEVTNFGLAKDTLQFNATLFSNFTAAMNAASQVGANTVFTIDANDTVTLDNVTKTSLTAGNFHFT
jgi:autotransporter passenger strand-loop-strand repeat protein